MLDQLIYTRCFPHRDLKLRGQVVRSDGFGVFSASAGLLAGDCRFLLKKEISNSARLYSAA